MKFDKEKLDSLLKEVTELNDITLSDIPDIDLYMDQVTTLFEKKLGKLKRDQEDKIMTKTMINNYAKANILPSVKGKKYNKNQIILLALIYNLKQNLSLNDIGSLFGPILASITDQEADREAGQEDNSNEVNELYSSFLELKRNQLQNFYKNFDRWFSIIKEKSAASEKVDEPEAKENKEEDKDKDKDKDTKQLILLVFALITQANIEKRMAEKIIDNFFNKEKLPE